MRSMYVSVSAVRASKKEPPSLHSVACARVEAIGEAGNPGAIFCAPPDWLAWPIRKSRSGDKHRRTHTLDINAANMPKLKLS
jgi:hypothetical protein